MLDYGGDYRILSHDYGKRMYFFLIYENDLLVCIFSVRDAYDVKFEIFTIRLRVRCVRENIWFCVHNFERKPSAVLLGRMRRSFSRNAQTPMKTSEILNTFYTKTVPSSRVSV